MRSPSVRDVSDVTRNTTLNAAARSGAGNRATESATNKTIGHRRFTRSLPRAEHIAWVTFLEGLGDAPPGRWARLCRARPLFTCTRMASASTAESGFDAS